MLEGPWPCMSFVSVMLVDLAKLHNRNTSADWLYEPPFFNPGQNIMPQDSYEN